MRPCDIPKLVDSVHSRLGKSSGEGAHHTGTQAAGLERRFHRVSGLGVIKVGTECGCCAVPSGCPVLTLRSGRGKRPFLYHQKGLSMNPVSRRHAWRRADTSPLCASGALHICFHAVGLWAVRLPSLRQQHSALGFRLGSIPAKPLTFKTLGFKPY